MFKLNKLQNESAAMGEHCGRFCNCQTLQDQEDSTTTKPSALNLKDFQKGRQVEHLVPNHIQNLVEVWWNLLFLSD